MPDPNSKLSDFSTNTQLQRIILVLVGLLAYSNTFQVPFVFDDTEQIVGNPIIQNLANFFVNGSGYGYNPNRFIGYLSFALNYHFGGESVAGYHLMNLAIHIANGLLLYALLRLVAQTPMFRDPEGGQAPGEHAGFGLVPFIAALLFVCHPVQTQAVTYIVQRLTSLATFFYLASLVLHLRWRLAHELGGRFTSTAVLPGFLLSLLAAILAMRTKEIAFTLPAAVILVELSFFGRPDRRRLLTLLPVLLTVVIIPLSMIAGLDHSKEFLAGVSKAASADATLSRGSYLVTQFCVICTYLRLLLLPVDQTLDYDYPVYHSLFQLRPLLSLGLLLTLLAAALWCWRLSSASRPGSAAPPGPAGAGARNGLVRLAAFGVLWFFLTLAVESSVIPIYDLICEHRVYLPGIGCFISVAALLTLLLEQPARASLVLLPLLLVAATALSAATYSRNAVWKDKITLWQDVERKSPGRYRAHNEIGIWYAEQGELSEAIGEIETAVRLNPDDIAVRYNLAQLYRDAGRLPEAAEQIRIISAVAPNALNEIENDLKTRYR